MPKYYVAKRPNIAGFHSVHKEGCPFLQAKSKIYELGCFSSSNDAIWRARSIYCNSNACIFCSKDAVAVNANALLEWNMFSTS